MTPITYGLPNCTVLQSRDILIIGGRDPLDPLIRHSKEVYLFDGKNFEKCADLPDVGQIQLLDDAIHFQPEVYIYSDNDYLFVYNIDKDTWSYQILQNK
jgi:hypothetical protein